MINVSHSIGIIVVCSVVTMLLRGAPFMIWSGDRKVPEIILWLGKVLPYAIMMMLTVYVLKNTSLSEIGGANGWLPALAGVVATSGSYAWKRNTLLSILFGTVVFMVLIRII